MAARFVIGKNATDEGSKQPSSRNSWGTIKPKPKETPPFSTHMTLAFALTAVMTAVVMIGVLAFVWENTFMAYTRQNMQGFADSTAEGLSSAYAEAGDVWTEDVLAGARSASSISADLGVQVLDANGKILYDDTWSHARTSTEKDDEVKGVATATGGYGGSGSGATNLTSSAPTDADAVVTADVCDSTGAVVGTVRLWAFGSEALLTKSDAAFRVNSYGAGLVAAAIAIVLACVIGFFTSKKMATPIQRITSTAKQIRNGDMTARSGVSGTDEIGQLGETFDDMASTLERDLKLEHRLTGDVAHELRTPLMAMQATVEAMQDGVLPADDEHFETVASEVRRLSRLVDAMLKLSRLENNTAGLKTERTDVVYLIKSLVSSQHALFHEKGLHLRFINESGRDEVMADIDADLIREAVVNLMSNAMRYTDADGYVKVSVKLEREDVLISVQDTGIGIAKEDIPQTFSRFWRSDVSRERVSGGLGVGLSLTKEIVDKHNGTILVESELGRGTTFTLRIPQNRGRRNLAQVIQEG